MSDKKVCVISGANNGIGFETALALAGQGATVVMLCRSRERGEAAQAKIAAATGNTPDLLLADLSLQREVVRVSAEIKQTYPHLDVLVNNAGAAFTKKQTTSEGLEMTFALNHLGYFRLTLELLDLIKASAPARIVNTSSSAHAWVRNFDLNNLQGEIKYGGFPAYGGSKLCNVLFTYELARRLEGTGVTVNCLNPGATTTYRSGSNRFTNLMTTLFKPFMNTARQGAAPIIYLASSDEVAGVTGKYYDYHCQVVDSAEITHDPAIAKQLWDKSLAIIETLE
ncbi:MAG: SDR family oxidoreductase [Candidatus Promineifilaceae bacterium]